MTHLGDWAIDGRCSRTSINVELFRRERRHSIDSIAICLSDIRPFMELIRLGVPEVCFLTHRISHFFQTIRETVEQRMTYKNKIYVEPMHETRFRAYLVLDSPNLAKVTILLQNPWNLRRASGIVRPSSTQFSWDFVPIVGGSCITLRSSQCPRW